MYNVHVDFLVDIFLKKILELIFLELVVSIYLKLLYFILMVFKNTFYESLMEYKTIVVPQIVSNSDCFIISSATRKL